MGGDLFVVLACEVDWNRMFFDSEGQLSIQLQFSTFTHDGAEFFEHGLFMLTIKTERLLFLGELRVWHLVHWQRQHRQSV